MDFNKSVLIVQAHPDDAEAWSGGTLKLLCDAGFRISICTLTAGAMGGMNKDPEATAALRKKEAAQAASLIAADYYCMDELDAYLFDSRELRTRMVDLIRKTKAGLVISHLMNDYHADHRAAAAICDAAAMVSALPNIPCCEAPLPITPLLYHNAPIGLTDPLGFPLPDPHFFVDISSVIETKMEMLGCHESQMQLMKHMFRIDDFFGEMRKFSAELGKMAGCDYAECYWQHLGGGYQRTPLLQDALKPYIKIL